MCVCKLMCVVTCFFLIIWIKLCACLLGPLFEVKTLSFPKWVVSQKPTKREGPYFTPMLCYVFIGLKCLWQHQQGVVLIIFLFFLSFFLPSFFHFFAVMSKNCRRHVCFRGRCNSETECIFIYWTNSRGNACFPK